MTSAPNLLASANTIGGFAIGVTQIADRTGTPVFEVVRINSQSRFVTISRHAEEATARKAANVEYRLDMGVAS